MAHAFMSARARLRFPFDTWSAERIEVLRGPASVLYGEGAIGGVINFVPKKPTDYFTDEALVAIGTDGMRRFRCRFRWPDQRSVRLSASMRVGSSPTAGSITTHGEFSSLALSGAFIQADQGSQTDRFARLRRSDPLSYWGTPLINGVIPDRFGSRASTSMATIRTSSTAGRNLKPNGPRRVVLAE